MIRSGHFLLLLLLWLTRAPGGAGTGWSVYFKDGFVTDGSSAQLVAFLLFVLPGSRNINAKYNALVMTYHI